MNAPLLTSSEATSQNPAFLIESLPRYVARKTEPYATGEYKQFPGMPET